MKKIHFIIALFIALFVAAPAASAQGTGATVEFTSLNSVHHKGGSGDYNGFSIKGGYQFSFLKMLYVEPQAGFVTTKTEVSIDGGNFDTTNWQTGVELTANLGAKIWPHVAIVTGPDVKFNCGNSNKLEHDHPVEAWWRFGLDIFVWRLRVRGTFGLGMNHPYYSDHNNSYTIGLAYRF